MAPSTKPAGQSGGLPSFLLWIVVAAALLERRFLVAAAYRRQRLAASALPVQLANDALCEYCGMCVCACDCVFLYTAALSARTAPQTAAFSSSSPVCCRQEPADRNTAAGQLPERPSEASVLLRPRTMTAELCRGFVPFLFGFTLLILVSRYSLSASFMMAVLRCITFNARAFRHPDKQREVL